MTLNILVLLKSGRKWSLIDIDYSDKETQDKLIRQNGQIEDIIILPGDFKECKKILAAEGLVKA